MKTIIYIHGFGSSGKSVKVDFLRSKYGDNVIAPNLFSKPEKDIVLLEEIVKNIDSPILVGSSLGGFYSEYLSSKYKLDSLLINPVSDVKDTKLLIGDHIYYDSKQPFTFTVKDYNDLIKYSNELNCFTKKNSKRIIIVAKDDMVLDYTKSIKHFNNDNIVVYDYGGHSFNLKSEILSNLEKLT